jgi:hypothetical protein
MRQYIEDENSRGYYRLVQYIRAARPRCPPMLSYFYRPADRAGQPRTCDVLLHLLQVALDMPPKLPCPARPLQAEQQPLQ